MAIKKKLPVKNKSSVIVPMHNDQDPDEAVAKILTMPEVGAASINRPINIRTHSSAYFSAYKVSDNRKKLFTSSIFCWIECMAERIRVFISSLLFRQLLYVFGFVSRLYSWLYCTMPCGNLWDD